MNKSTLFFTFFFFLIAQSCFSQNYEELVAKADNYFKNKEYNRAGELYIKAFKVKNQKDKYAKAMLDSCSKATKNQMFIDAALELEKGSNPDKEEIETINIVPPRPPVEKPKPLKPEEPIYRVVEQMPEFSGGIMEMYRFIGNNLKYPVEAQRANIQGKVFVKFVIEKDGSIGKKTILKSLGYGCDEEVLRVISLMPKWEAGRQNGKNVRVYYTTPINFILEEVKTKN